MFGRLRSAAVLISGIPRTGLSQDQERVYGYIYKNRQKRRFQFNIRPTTFPDGHTHKGGCLLFRAEAIYFFYFFLYIFTPFSFYVPRVKSSRHVFRLARSAAPSSVPFNSEKYKKKKRTKRDFFLFYFIPRDLVQIFTYTMFYRYIYTACGTKTTIK